MSSWQTQTGYKRHTRLNLDVLTAIRKNLGPSIKISLIETAHIIAKDAADNAAKDTEFLAESIHVVSVDYSEYDISKNVSTEKFQSAKALGRTPKGHRLGPKSEYTFLPEIRPTDPNEVWVVVGAKHGAPIENSATNRRPFLVPAVYSNKSTFTQGIRNVLSGISVKAVVTKRNKLEEDIE